MKLFIGDILNLLTIKQERNIKVLIKFFLALIAIVTIYSLLFHVIMMAENKNYSWITGFYWTLTVMSTLGFGDITFTSDIGKIFSIIVLLSGIIFLLTMLPFIFIRFFYMPWLEFQTKARTHRDLPEETENHVILTNYDPITINLVERLKHYNYGHVIITQDAQQALELQDMKYNVVVGDLDNADTYRRIKAEKAALVVANSDDMMNTNIAFTVREVSKDVPIVVNSDLEDSVDILALAGSTYVFQFMKMLGQSLARRVLGTITHANVIGSIDSLLIAEAAAMRTPLVGKTLKQCNLREKIGITVVGIWERGRFEIPYAQTLINPTSVLLIAGSEEQLKQYDEQFGHYQENQSPVLILGGGRVGRAAAESLSERNIDYRVIEKHQKLLQNDKYIIGSAADINTLLQAGINEAPSILITTHDDPTNIYLTIYCRKLRPEIQIISRANFDRNISKLHAAGADLVMSYASMATNMILNVLKPGKFLMLAEGLNVFRVNVHPLIIGKSLAESHIRSGTGCSVIAIYNNNNMMINPDPAFSFKEGNELILIGTNEAEKKFHTAYPETNKI